MTIRPAKTAFQDRLKALLPSLLRQHDCINDACAVLGSAQFARWQRLLEKTSPGERMDAIMSYLEKHHADVVERVVARHLRAHGKQPAVSTRNGDPTTPFRGMNGK